MATNYLVIAGDVFSRSVWIPVSFCYAIYNTNISLEWLKGEKKNLPKPIKMYCLPILIWDRFFCAFFMYLNQYWILPAVVKNKKIATINYSSGFLLHL